MAEVVGLSIVAEWNNAEVQKGVSQLKALLGSISGISTSLTADMNASSRSISNSLVGQKSAFQELREQVKQSIDTGKSLTITQGKTSLAFREQAEKIKELKEQLNSANNSIRRQTDEYGRLQQAANMATRHAQNMAIKYGESSEVFKGASQRAYDFTQRLKDIDAATGRNFRNVGNYAEGMSAGFKRASVSMSFMATEIPNFFISARTGLMSLSNNLPMFINEMKQGYSEVKAKNLELAASGQPVQSMFQSVLATINPWQVAIGLGVGLLTAYGPKLIELATGTDKYREELEKLEKEQMGFSKNTEDNKRKLEALKQSIQDREAFQKRMITIDRDAIKSYSEQSAKLLILNTVLTSNTSTTKQKTEAIEQIKQLYPSYNAEIDNEYRKTGNLSNLINKELIPALKNKALAMAISEKFTEVYKKIIDNELKLTKAVKDRADAVAKIPKSTVLNTDQKVQLNFNSVGKVGAEMAIQLLNKDSANLKNQLSSFEETYKGLIQKTGKLDLSGTNVYKSPEKIDRFAEDKKNADDTKDKVNKLNEAIAEFKRGLESIDEKSISGFDKLKEKLETSLKFKSTLHNKFKVNFDSSTMKDIDTQIDALKKDYYTRFEEMLKDMERDGSIDIELKLKTNIDVIKERIATINKELKELQLKGYSKTSEIYINTRAKLSIEEVNLDKAELGKKVMDIIGDYNNDEHSINIEVNIGKLTQLHAVEEYIKSTINAIKKLNGLSVSPNSNELVQLKNRLDTLNMEAFYLKIKDAQDSLNQSKNEIDWDKKMGVITSKEATSKTENILRSLKNKIVELMKIAPKDFNIDGLKNWLASIDKALSDNTITQKIDEFGAMLERALEDLIISVAEGFAKGLATGDFGGLWESIKKQMGASLKEFGKWMIVQAIKIQALKSAFLKTIIANPALAIPIGIALVAMGAAMEASMGKKAKSTGKTAFANGGIVYGATNALVGEYPGASNNPEVIAPLNKLKELLPNNGGSNMHVTFDNPRIKGSDIELVVKRTEQYRNL